MTKICAAHGEAGISLRRGFEYFDDPPDDIKRLNPDRAAELGIERFTLLPQDELPQGVKMGYSFQTWCVNPMVYCCFLLRRFTLQGGKILKRELKCPEEALAFPDYRHIKFIVNASGNGFNDSKSFITRGMAVVRLFPMP